MDSLAQTTHTVGGMVVTGSKMLEFAARFKTDNNDVEIYEIPSDEDGTKDDPEDGLREGLHMTKLMELNIEETASVLDDSIS